LKSILVDCYFVKAWFTYPNRRILYYSNDCSSNGIFRFSCFSYFMDYFQSSFQMRTANIDRFNKFWSLLISYFSKFPIGSIEFPQVLIDKFFAVGDLMNPNCPHFIDFLLWVAPNIRIDYFVNDTLRHLNITNTCNKWENLHVQMFFKKYITQCTSTDST